MQKAPNRRPNAACSVCSGPFYRPPSRPQNTTCSMVCRTKRYRMLGVLLTGGKSGPDNWRWKGGRYPNDQGYILVLARDHPRADRHGYVREHRLVMEKTLGRYLEPQEVVHHLNHIRDDNRPENLDLYPSNGAHKHNEHKKGRPPRDPD